VASTSSSSALFGKNALSSWNSARFLQTMIKLFFQAESIPTLPNSSAEIFRDLDWGGFSITAGVLVAHLFFRIHADKSNM